MIEIPRKEVSWISDEIIYFFPGWLKVLGYHVPAIVKCRDKNHVLLTRFLPNLDDTDSLLNKSSTVIMVVLYQSLDVINLSLSLSSIKISFCCKIWIADLAKK